jgi:hypothetical protein
MMLSSKLISPEMAARTLKFRLLPKKQLAFDVLQEALIKIAMLKSGDSKSQFRWNRAATPP